MSERPLIIPVDPDDDGGGEDDEKPWTQEDADEYLKSEKGQAENDSARQDEVARRIGPPTP
ncbi:MAG TPA: hypothetical protein DEP87_02335 [Candidatus Pacebacteria bacterium]|nr:hypothetical protein [Candidatus Paceibacterota bacterium]